jgi:1-deoxy-D-xylulose-5-phosphate synthase
MWDLSILGVVPGMRVAAPRDGSTFSAALREAVEHVSGPTAVRFPKGALGADLPALRVVDGSVDVLFENYGADDGVEVLIVAVGPLAAAAVEAGASIAHDGWAVRVASPTWIRPVPHGVLELARSAELVVTVEDGGLSGGFGSWVAHSLREHLEDRPLLTLGLAQEFLDVGKRADLLAGAGLDAESIEQSVRDRMRAVHAALNGEPPATDPAPNRPGNVVDLSRIETRGTDPAAGSSSS